MARKANDQPGSRFGIGEWYGTLFGSMDPNERAGTVRLAKSSLRDDRPICPFRSRLDKVSQPCMKPNGVCSMKLYQKSKDGNVTPVEGDLGQLRCLCPHRFNENGTVSEWIGQVLLGSARVLEVGEVPFLSPEVSGDTAPPMDSDSGSVGRIDRVLVRPDVTPMQWCAVEMQAVYFSGPALTVDFPSFTDPNVQGLPFPTRVRRPDYRSSGPKRLMPQLQIKVPTLRRWGKKMAVVVDESFFGSLGKMNPVQDVSNADIAWFVVRFEEQASKATLTPHFVRFTTLEQAVEGLTAGSPTSLHRFEAEIQARLKRLDR